MVVNEEDALALSLPDGYADCVISSFGLKTFSPDQTRILARQVHRMLKPGGRFSFLEISVPRSRLLRAIYMFYLHRIIPLIGRAFMGNADNYRMLGVYTSRFGGCSEVARLFAEGGLTVREVSLFLGCATAITGTRPVDK